MPKPRKKKPFIDKKNAVTFHLVHRSQRDPQVANEAAPGRVLLQSAEKETKKEEERKYGVFYEDDYDYLQHLRDTSELTNDFELEESFRLTKEEPLETCKGNVVDLPSSVFASELETDVGLLNKAVPLRGPQPDWDPDIVAGLDDDFDFDDPSNQLDDDFIVKANTGEMHSEGDLVDEDGLFEDENECKVHRMESDDEDEEDDDSGEDFPSDEAEESDDEVGSLGEHTFMDEETKSRFTNYSISSSVIKRTEGLTLLDDRFEKLFEEYDDEEVGALDHEDIMGDVGDNSKLMDAVLDEFEKTKEERARKYKDAIEPAVDVEFDSDAESSDDEIEKMVIREPKSQWDCESICSTYSNLYNHPKTIEEPKKQKTIKLSTKTGIPLNILGSQGPTLKDIEREFGDTDRSDLPTTQRPKNESKEERKARKTAIKEHRKERRIEKKATKTAFKEEKIRQDKQFINAQKNIQGLKIA